MTIPRSNEDWTWPVGYASASVSDLEVIEGQVGAATVTLDQPLPSDVSIDWAVLAGTATAPDLPLGTGTVTIPAGSTETTIDVATVDDDIDEPDEQFTVALTGAANGLQLDRAQGTGILVDNDEAPTVTLTPTEVLEGDTTLTDAVVEVALSHPSSDEIAVTFESADGSAVANDDYTVLDTTVTVAPGETSTEVHVAVRGDTVVEPDEFFEIVARDHDGTTLDTTTVTIVDDDALSLSIDPLVTLDEGTGGTTTAQVAIRIDPAPLPGESVTVGYGIITDTATIPDDIADTAGTIVLTADTPTAVVDVDVVTDDIPEDDEVFRVAFSNATASDGRSVLGTRHATVVVYNDDDHNAPPDCETVQANPTLLWPPNHTFQTVTVEGGTDPDGDPVTLTITTVTQDEPVNSRGDGNTSPDARWRDRGDEVDLRAERDGSGDGRIYRIGITASDGHGGTCETTVQVGVPKAKSGRHATPVDSSLIVDSFGTP